MLRLGQGGLPDVLAGNNDLAMLTVDEANRGPELLIQTEFSEQNAEISPDGRWLAYQSNESGEYQIYVRPFPEVDGWRERVSTRGGTRPLWARDGRELFYWGPNGEMTVVAVQPGPTIIASTPRSCSRRHNTRSKARLRQAATTTSTPTANAF